MKRMLRKLRGRRGLTLVETLVAVGVLALLGMMLSTGLFMAHNSYQKMTQQSESQLLLSTLSNLLSNELRYARDVVTTPRGTLQRYTSVNYGRNTTLSLNDQGQLEANHRQMLSAGAYGNGAHHIESCEIIYDDTGIFHVTLQVGNSSSIFQQITFDVRCLNPTGNDKGGNA